MTQLLFATNNHHKIKEVRDILGEGFVIHTLAEANILEDLPETGQTLEENAIQKANFILENYGYECFSEDTGLEVSALKGAPGVHTARFAGPGADPEANISKLLTSLEGIADRSARFRTVIALRMNGDLHMFHGVVEGRISLNPQGSLGFGYDPVFIPAGHDYTFAELDPRIKSTISHRARAVQQLVGFLSGKGNV